MFYEVSLTKDAERDLEEIYFYNAEHDSRASADRVLERLVQTTGARRTSPDRGQVIVYVVADGRRDIESLLARRLLGP